MSEEIRYGSGTCPDCGEHLGTALFNWESHNCIHSKVKDNKIIAQFMGAEFIDPIGHSMRDVQFKQQTHGLYVHSGNELKYHLSWDWLMPVVEKISKVKLLNAEDEFDVCHPITFNMPNRETGNPMVRFIGFGLHEAPTLIEATWLSVIDFIKFNNQKKQNENQNV